MSDARLIARYLRCMDSPDVWALVELSRRYRQQVARVRSGRRPGRSRP